MSKVSFSIHDSFYDVVLGLEASFSKTDKSLKLTGKVKMQEFEKNDFIARRAEWTVCAEIEKVLQKNSSKKSSKNQ